MAAIGATSDQQFLVEKPPMRGLKPEGYGLRGKPEVSEPNYQITVMQGIPEEKKRK